MNKLKDSILDLIQQFLSDIIFYTFLLCSSCVDRLMIDVKNSTPLIYCSEWWEGIYEKNIAVIKRMKWCLIYL